MYPVLMCSSDPQDVFKKYGIVIEGITQMALISSLVAFSRKHLLLVQMPMHLIALTIARPIHEVAERKRKK